MVYVSSGTPEDDRRAWRLNLASVAVDDQARAHIRDFYGEMRSDERADFRTFLTAYIHLQNNRLHLARFAGLCQNIGSLPTNAELLAVVDSIEPFEF